MAAATQTIQVHTESFLWDWAPSQQLLQAWQQAMLAKFKSYTIRITLCEATVSLAWQTWQKTILYYNSALCLSCDAEESTGGPSSQCYPFSFPFYANVQANVTYGMYYYITTTRNMTPALQHMEVLCYNGLKIKVCMGMQRLCLKSQLFLYFVNKIYLPCCCVVFFVVCQLLGPI